MTYIYKICITSVLVIMLISISGTEGTKFKSNNLTCYQCVKTVNEECGEESLLPCPPVSDRCVTHISKHDKAGFTIKRECGLGPCGFDDEMMNRGLGLDGCDRSKDEYFCVFCCRTSGCNKSKASLNFIPSINLCLASICIIFASLKFISVY